MSKKLNKKVKKYALNKYFFKETDPSLIGVYDTSYSPCTPKCLRKPINI